MILILVFLLYTTFGASVFLLVEGPYQNTLKNTWDQVFYSFRCVDIPKIKKIGTNRTTKVNFMMSKMFNNSDYLIYIKGATTERLKLLLNE